MRSTGAGDHTEYGTEKIVQVAQTIFGMRRSLGRASMADGDVGKLVRERRLLRKQNSKYKKGAP